MNLMRMVAEEYQIEPVAKIEMALFMLGEDEFNWEKYGLGLATFGGSRLLRCHHCGESYVEAGCRPGRGRRRRSALNFVRNLKFNLNHRKQTILEFPQSV